jgi:enoyl-CoA hydratase
MPKRIPKPETFETILIDRPIPAVMRITLNRPDSRNAQNPAMLYELNDAFDVAARDDEIKVIILAANGPHFSSGHDLRITDFVAEMSPYEPVGTWCGFSCRGAEGRYSLEKEMFIGLCERWRNLPKVTIAQVQGKAVAGGLMLIWPCDLIIASEDAMFADNTVAMGVVGAEFFNHPWELGVRKAKEMLFTTDFVSAQDAHRLGMVNHVVTLERLEEFTLALAARITKKSNFVLKLTKEAVNAAQDAQGRGAAMKTSFALHHLSHAHNYDLFDLPIDPSGIMSESTKANFRPKKAD